MKRVFAISLYAMVVGAACQTADRRAEQWLSAGDGVWTATTFTKTLQPGGATDGRGELDWSGDVEFFFSDVENFTAGTTGTFYREGTITLPDGWVVDIDWKVYDNVTIGGDVYVWMLVYEDAGLDAGEYVSYPRYLERDRVGMAMGTGDQAYAYDVEIALEK